MPDDSAPKRWTDEDGTFHEQYRAAIFVAGTHLGEFAFDPGAWPSLHYRRRGIAYFCPTCGDVWARIVLWDSAESQSELDSETVSCENHADQWNTPGSLLSAGLDGLADLLPADALRREFYLYQKRLEKNNG